jgi:hypothetical protein
MLLPFGRMRWRSRVGSGIWLCCFTISVWPSARGRLKSTCADAASRSWTDGRFARGWALLVIEPCFATRPTRRPVLSECRSCDEECSGLGWRDRDGWCSNVGGDVEPACAESVGDGPRGVAEGTSDAGDGQEYARGGDRGDAVGPQD